MELSGSSALALVIAGIEASDFVDEVFVGISNPLRNRSNTINDSEVNNGNLVIGNSFDNAKE
jgi:hypothetical protein